MASEFQRRKVAVVFGAMDTDGDGYLTESDFTELTMRWTELRRAAPGTRDHARLSAIMMGWWHTLLAVSDQDRDGKVTPEEVLIVVDRLPAMLDVVTDTARAMFEAIDENADNEITAGEYRQLIEAWTGRKADTDDVFARLDRDGDGRLTQEEFTLLWAEFWAGDDPEAPGTWVFGDFELPALSDHR
ncbi:EF-hand domain-containing protein [Umezawaea sp. NPDC059074]|uniref:EF-hand domain-containing protein n=1 Tax=Umezawaea sp. NPDC059074 TaxID=3346716 RepID=UPI0036C24260